MPVAGSFRNLWLSTDVKTQKEAVAFFEFLKQSRTVGRVLRYDWERYYLSDSIENGIWNGDRFTITVIHDTREEVCERFEGSGLPIVSIQLDLFFVGENLGVVSSPYSRSELFAITS